MKKTLVEARNLKKYFPLKQSLFQIKRRFVYAVDDVSFSIREGETLGVVGESGCGKTTVSLLVLRLLEPDSGTVFFDDLDMYKIPKSKMKEFRRKAQIVFQNHRASLDPRMTVRTIIGSAIRLHQLASGKAVEERILDLLNRVGLKPEHIDRYPHEFSGGQRQRIAIARALAVEPKFIVLDEPTSSLDVSVQAHILNDLKQLQKDFGLTYLFVSHNLSVIRHVSDRVAVMYLGKLVEVAPADKLFSSPQHPYSETLISSIPVPDPDVRPNRIHLKGEVPSPADPPSGCSFHPRCPYAFERCPREIPLLWESIPDQQVACHLRH